MQLTVAIYAYTEKLPKSETFGLMSQMRRAAVSIPSNIAEGYGQGSGNFARHLQIAVGSVYELRTQLEICERLLFVSSEENALLQPELIRLSKMIHGLVKTTKG
jgi:four helix bundle protein